MILLWTDWRATEPLDWYFFRSGPVFCSLANFFENYRRLLPCKICTACKTSILNICAVKERLILNIFVWLRKSVVLFVAHLLHSIAKQRTQTKSVDRSIAAHIIWKTLKTIDGFYRLCSQNITDSAGWIACSLLVSLFIVIPRVITLVKQSFYEL